jgi:putative hemolysin
MKLVAIDKVNRVYENSGAFHGPAFAGSLLRDLGVDYLVGHAERLESLPEGAFITISNHPYGGLDGIISIELIAGIRPDYKFMVNKILSHVKTMQENFISVIPMGDTKLKTSAETIRGIRETLQRLRDGHPVGFFPSGAVSDFSLREMFIRDRPWQNSLLELIRSAKVPILPLRFFDRNSIFFYFLGLISPKIRLMRMPHEVFNKRDRLVRLGIGEIIPVALQEEFADLSGFGNFLWKAVYEMPVPDSFIRRSCLNLPG